MFIADDGRLLSQYGSGEKVTFNLLLRWLGHPYNTAEADTVFYFHITFYTGK